MDVTIRAVEPSDVPGLGILRRQAIEATFRSDYDRAEFVDLVAGTDDDLEQWVHNEAVTVLLVETEVTPVSYAALDRETAELLALFTSPDYQEEGFATLLLDRIEERTDVSTVETVAPEPAVGFFQRRGFEAIADAEWHGLPGKRMEKRR